MIIILIFQKLKEEQEEKAAQTRILQFLKNEDVTKDFLAYVEERSKRGLSIVPDFDFEEVRTPDYDCETH